MNFISPRQKESLTFLELSYEELKERNLAIKKEFLAGKNIKEKVCKMLAGEKGIKAVTIGFPDAEGRLHMLDYHKDYFLSSHDNLTFDGSSIRGFTTQDKSDLRLSPDWRTLRYLPADIFGGGKVFIFSNIADKDGNLYDGDFRGILSKYAQELEKSHNFKINVAPEIEGFLFEGENAEYEFDEKIGFRLASKGGYFNSLPQDTLRIFIDRLAEATAAMAFENEKDHPEVAPSQFELSYRYTDILIACDQIMLYKVTARQIAKMMGLTASFLPKPVAGINGSGMHTNISISKYGKNLFHNPKGNKILSKEGFNFAYGIMTHANDLCLVMNSSVNAYRRLDPKFEAPNEINISGTDRGSMIRIPIGNEKSARIEVRTVAPDCNPYLTYYLLLKAGIANMLSKKPNQINPKRPIKKLYSSIQGAIKAFKRSDFISKCIGKENMMKFCKLKEAVQERSPEKLGNIVKNGEVLYHHEITNQVLWKQF